MTPDQWKCAECGAEFLGGDPPQTCTVFERTGTRIEFRCLECAERVAEALWPVDEWGPFPSRLQHRRDQKGRG